MIKEIEHFFLDLRRMTVLELCLTSSRKYMLMCLFIAFFLQEKNEIV